MSTAKCASCNKTTYYLNAVSIDIRHSSTKTSRNATVLVCPNCGAMVCAWDYDVTDAIHFDIEELSKLVQQLKNDVSDIPTDDASSRIGKIEKLLLALAKSKKI